MQKKQHLDQLLRSWTFDPHTLNVREVRGEDGRDILQMRVDMGILQMEWEGRPDGAKPEGCEHYLGYLMKQETQDADFEMDDDQCFEADREFVQYYHRRIAWLRLGRYHEAVRDADHTLALMDICRDHSPDEDWTISHEQYRPFVLFHRTQAASMAAIEADQPALAMKELKAGLDTIRSLFVQHEAEEAFDEDEMVQRLRELLSRLRDEYPNELSLQEQLEKAVQSEQYELAAQLRDQLAEKKSA